MANTFKVKKLLSSSGVFSSSVEAPNLVYNTGDQTISGNKTFNNTITINTISGTSSSSNSLNLIAANNTAPVSNPGDINLTAGTGIFPPNYGSINLNAGGPKYNGNINLNGNIEINYAGFGDPTIASRTINIYKTGTVFGAPGAIAALTIDNNNISLNDPGFGAQGFGLLISGVPVTPALYATITNLASTGSTLATNLAATGSANLARINSLSGYSNSTFATITNLAATGSNLQTQINNLDLTYATDASVTAVANNLTTTGSTLNTKIDNLSGYSNNTFATITNLAATGSANLARINSLSGYSNNTFATITNLAATGSNLQTQINNLDLTYATDASVTAVANNLTTTGSTLNTKIDNLSGYSNNTFATITNLAATGSANLARINSLSGTLTSTYATIANLASTGSTLQTNINTVTTNLASTGSTLNTRINNLSGYINSTGSNIVFTTGNQTINGVKTFTSNIFAPNLVYTTGNQIITGLKSFVNSSDYLVAKFEGQNGNPLEIFSTDDSFNGGYGSAAYAIGVGGYGFAVKYSSSDTDWGQPILLSEGGTTVVNPTSTITFPQPLLAPNLVYSSGDYNYFTTSTTLGNSYINLANSTSAITATLPSIASGRNYIVKNLNTGTLTVTGSALIDGNVNLKLYKNESAHLLGVNNVGFTGWVSLNTNPGIS